MFQHCARILKFRWDESLATGDITFDDIHRWARARRDQFTVCSCWMCCNPRRLRNSNGPALTVQELRAAEGFRLAMEDLGDE